MYKTPRGPWLRRAGGGQGRRPPGSARAAVPGSAFLLCDVLREPDRIQGAFDAIFIDINGSRAYDTVLKCVRWAEVRWPSALVVVKSSEAMRMHFPGAIETDAPARQRA